MGRQEHIKQFCEEKGIRHLVHFTRLSNLESILVDGLRPRVDLDKSQAEFNDQYRYDSHQDAVCLSVSFPNYQMFYRYRQESEDTWVVLEVDVSVLWKLDCAFCIENAASASVKNVPIDERRSVAHLKKMFDDVTYRGEDVSRAELGIPVHYPTHPQAEVLVFEPIDATYLQCVNAASISACREIKTAIPSIGIDVFPGSNYFKPRSDWAFWKELKDRVSTGRHEMTDKGASESLRNWGVEEEGATDTYEEKQEWSQEAVQCFNEGIDALTKGNYIEAFIRIQQAAGSGHTRAQMMLSMFHSSGVLGPRNDRKALYWTRKAAEEGNLSALHALGLMYFEGRGVEQDERQAVKWYRRAAEQGYARSQNNLGFCYAEGRGVGQDHDQAVRWYGRAAEQGNAYAQKNLGFCYLDGRGVSQDQEQAVKWLRKAAEQGHAGAQNNLGFCYLDGRGVSQNQEQAVKWFRMAAEQRVAIAQKNLGVCHAEGLGVGRDHEQAVKWLRKAAEQGNHEAQKALDNLGA